MTDKIDNGDVPSGSLPNNAVDPFPPQDRDTIPANLLQFENLISGFSSVLIDASAEKLENELHTWLKKFVDFLKVDRSILVEYLDDLKTLQVLMHYTLPEVDAPPVESTYIIPEGQIEEFQKGMVIRAEQIPEDLPKIFRGGPIERDNTKSLVIVPLTGANKIIGSLTFANYRREYKWPDDLVRRIKLIGEIIANAILRIRSHKILRNETERRHILEERYASVVRNANVGFWISDSNQNILDVNDEYCRMSGYNRDELLSMKIPDIDINFSSKKEELTEEIEVVGAVHHEATHKKKDGNLIDLDVSSTLHRSENILISFMMDITELKQTRKELEERLRFEELISEFSTTLIIPGEIQIELTNWIKKFVEFLRVDRGVVVEYLEDKKSGRVIMQYTVPDAVVPPLKDIHIIPGEEIKEFQKGTIIRAERIPDDLPQAFRGGIIEKDKTKSIIIAPLSIANKVIGRISFSNFKKERIWPDDVVRRIKLIGEIIANAILRIRSNKALLEEMARRQKLEERYTSILKNTNVGFFIADYESNIIDVNDEYCRWSGYNRDELLSMKIYDLQLPMTPDEIQRISDELTRTGSTHHEAIHQRKDGSFIDLFVSSTILDENIYFSFMRDITELNRTKRERDERLKFEELISDFSASLINIKSDDIIKELLKWLEVFVSFLKVDRGIVNEYLGDQRTVRVVVQYTDSEVDIEPLYQNYTTPEGEIEEFQKGLIIRAEKIPEDLPKMLHGGLIEKDNTRSLIIVPLSIGDRVIGSLTFASYRKECKWSDDLVRRIKLIGEIIANAVLRIRSHEDLVIETERRKMLEERYSSIIRTANVGFMISDLNARIIDVNDTYSEMSGYSRDELLGMTIDQLDVSHDVDKVESDLKGIFEIGSFHHETSHIRKDGAVINVLVSANLLEKEGIVFSFIRDVTEMNRAQKEHTERLEFEELFSEFSAALINIELDDLNEELKKWAIKFVDFLELGRCVINEYQFEKNIIKLMVSHTDPDSAAYTSPHDMDLTAPDIVMDEFRKGTAIRAEKIPEDLQAPFLGWIIEKHNTKSLVVVPLIARHKVIGNLTLASYRKERKWPDYIFDRIKLIGVIIANAILRKRSSDALLAEMEHRQLLEEKYTSIIKTANVGFWIADLNSRILEVNDAYCMMSGYSRDELLGMTIEQIDLSLNPEHRIHETKRLLEKGGFNIEASHTRKDGTIIEVAVNSTFLEKEGIVFTFLRDITELRKARKDLEDRLQFEELNSQFSAALVNVKPDFINEELKHWVKKFVEFLKVDRGMFHEYDYDNQTINVLASYTDPDVDFVASPIRESHLAPDEIIKEFKKGITIRAERIPEDLPPLFRGGILERHNTKSIVIVPLNVGDQVIGNLTFVNYRKERKWSDDLIRRIKLIGEVVAHAVLRIRSHKTLLEEMDRRQKLEERYTSIIKTANVGFWITDQDLNILVVNDEYCRMSGYSREELLTKKVWDLDATGEPSKVTKDLTTMSNKGSTHLITTHKRKDGSLFDIEVSAKTYEKEGYICNFIRDITELKQAREELEERLKFEELISEFSTILIIPGDIKIKLTNWLRKFVEFLRVDRGVVVEYLEEKRSIQVMMQYTVPHVIVPPLKDIHIVPEGEIEKLQKGIIIRAERIPEDLPQMFHGGLIERDKTKSLLMVPLSIGDIVIGHLSFSTYREERQWADAVVMRIKLIGEIIANAVLRKRSSDALIEEMERRQELEERYTSIIKTANVGFMIIDLSEHAIIDVNDEYCRMSGYSRDELITKHTWDIDSSMDPDKVRKEGESLIKEGSFHLMTSHIRKDGSVFDVEISSNLLGRDDIVYSFVRDITDLNKARKELEERLEFEKLVSDFSAALINVDPDNIDIELNNWLKFFVNFLEVDRGIINDHSREDNLVHLLYNYTIPDIDPIPLSYQHKTIKRLKQDFEKGKIVKAEKIPDDLPQILRGGLIEKENAKSAIIVPMIASNMVIGNLTFLNYREERQWPDDLVNRIKLIGEIFANTILRLRSHEALLKETERRHMLQERYTSILKNANVGFFLADYENNIIDVNDEYCRWSGYSRDELLTMKIYDLQLSMPTDENKRVSDELSNTGATHHEATHKKKDGGTLELYVSSTVLDENTFFSFMRDITELNRTKREREERLRFEEVISEFSTALINIQPDDIEHELGKWLIKFVELLDVDRCAVNEYTDNQRIIKNLMQYSVPEVGVSIPDIRKTPEGEIFELEKGIIKIESIHEDLPQMYHSSFIQRTKAKSLVIVPLLTGNRIFGNLALTSYRKELKWSDELIRRIKLISEIVGNAILRKHSHEALLEEMNSRHLLEEKYTSIIKNASVGFMISDHDQNILDVNDEYCRMSGYSYNELIKMKISDIDFSESPQKVDDDIALTVESGLYHHHTKHIHKSGRIFDVEVNSQYSESEGFFFSFVRDVTELNRARRELEERLKFEEFVSLLSTALINVKLGDISKEINQWLKRFVKLLNVDRCIVSEYLDNFTKINYVYSYTKPEVETQIRPLPSNEVETYGYHVYLQRDEIIAYESPHETFPEDIRLGLLESVKDGTKSLLLVPLKAGEMLLGVMSISTVISERRWTKEVIRRLKLVAEIFANALTRDKTDFELESYRKDLEKMVDERTARLREAQQELVLSEKMATLGRLTSTVSHELRNPLGTIRSSLFSINRRLKGQDEKTEKALERAERSIQRCDIIIEELLDYSKAQSLTLRPTDIDKWVTELFEDEKPPEDIILEKELNAGISIEMDRERLRRCMINILTNAYQSIEEKADDSKPGCVRVVTKKEKSRVIIEISDNGVGFAQEDVSKILEPLYSTKTFGVGLGIPITKQIVEMHGWRMDMMGEPGKGALVTISIPITS